MTIKISSKRPDDDLNGLDDIVDVLNDKPYEPVIAVVMLKRLRGIIEDEQDQDGTIPVIRFVHIEPLADDAAATARALLTAARAKRNGNGGIAPTLPLAPDAQGDTDGWDEGPVAERTPDAWLDDKGQG